MFAEVIPFAIEDFFRSKIVALYLDFANHKLVLKISFLLNVLNYKRFLPILLPYTSAMLLGQVQQFVGCFRHLHTLNKLFGFP